MPVDDEGLSELLSRLERVWRQQGAPIAEHLAPGIAPAELDALTASLGLVVPTELQIWWRWHNGTTASLDSVERMMGPGHWGFPSVSEVIDRYLWEVNGDNAEPEGIYWRKSWLPIIFIDTKNTLYVDTAAATPNEPIPVRLRTWEWSEPLKDRSASFTAAVAIWVGLLESGDYQWDAASQAWRYDWAAIPVALRTSGLI